MGSGGAARAAAYALDSLGCRLSVSGRNKETVGEICKEFGCEQHTGDVRGFDLVVNCTPIGLVEKQHILLRIHIEIRQRESGAMDEFLF